MPRPFVLVIVFDVFRVLCFVGCACCIVAERDARALVAPRSLSLHHVKQLVYVKGRDHTVPSCFGSALYREWIQNQVVLPQCLCFDLGT